MDRDNASSTATQAKSGMTRRGIMRKATAIGVGSAATVGGVSRMGSSPVGSARAIAPALLVGGGIAAGVAVSYATKNFSNPFTGDSNEDYVDKNADTTHAQIRENALAAKQADTAVYGNLGNLLNSSSNHVIAQAKKAAIDSLNTDGSTTQDAVDAALSEVDEFFATQEKNLFAHTEAQYSKFKNWVSQANNTEGLSSSDVFHPPGNTDNAIGSASETQATATLVDGSSYEFTKISLGNTNSIPMIDNTMTGDDSSGKIVVTDPSSSDVTTVLNDNEHAALYTDISNLHSNISTEMETWVNGIASSYQSGEISSSDLISSNDLISDSQTQDGFSFAGASLASLGLKSSDYSLSIELVETGETVNGAIYHNDDTIESLQKDVQYDPETDIQGTVYLAYNNTTDDKGELVGLEEPFIIRAITDGEGNEYNAANYSSKNQQDYSQDLQETEKQLDQIREIRETLEAQRDAAATDDGGAGAGFFAGGDSKTLGLVAAGGAVIALLLGNR